MNDIIADRPWGYRRRARLSLSYQPKTERLEMGFRKASSSDIVSVTQCPVLVPHLEALLPDVHHCLASLDGVRSLGHVELVLANSGPLMVLRHTAPLSKADRENWNAFRILMSLRFSSRRKARCLSRSAEKRHGMRQTGYA